MAKFRLIVRGADAAGIRRRRVRTVEAASYEDAWAGFEAEHKAMSRGLRDTFCNVFLESGYRLDGTPSEARAVAA